MNNAYKLTALAVILALCCAGLAGTAYAYTATYTDSVDEQAIDDVYMVVSAVNGNVGAVDVDIEYNTLNTASAIYYKVYRATIGDEASTMAKVDGNTARVCLLVDTVTVTAHGDDSELSKISASSTLAGDSAHGAAAFLYLSATELAAVPTASAYSDLALSETLADGESVTVYAYLVVDIAQLGDACGIAGYADYAEPSKLGDVTIGEFTVAYTAHAAQA